MKTDQQLFEGILESLNFVFKVDFANEYTIRYTILEYPPNHFARAVVNRRKYHFRNHGGEFISSLE